MFNGLIPMGDIMAKKPGSVYIAKVIMVDPQEVHRLIAAALPGARIQVLDPMRDGEHLQAVVAVDAFVGLTLVKQHKLVMEALREVLHERLHALQLRTLTPEQYDKEYK